MIVTKSNIADLKANPAWQEILERAKQHHDAANGVEIENTDPFFHGKAVGKREAYKTVMEWPEKLLAEVERKR